MVKPRANGRSNVGQQLPTPLELDVVCCVRLHTPLHVVACCRELLHSFAHHGQHERNNSRHYWPNNIGSCCDRLQVALIKIGRPRSKCEVGSNVFCKWVCLSEGKGRGFGYGKGVPHARYTQLKKQILIHINLLLCTVRD